MEIRPAQLADAAALVELFAQLGYSCTSTEIASSIRTAEPHNLLLVGVEANQVIGAIAVHLIAPFHAPDKWAWISALVVQADARSQGIGAQLLQHVEMLAHTAGCRKIELASNQARHQAHAFYLRQGYAERPKRFVKWLVE